MGVFFLSANKELASHFASATKRSWGRGWGRVGEGSGREGLPPKPHMTHPTVMNGKPAHPVTTPTFRVYLMSFLAQGSYAVPSTRYGYNQYTAGLALGSGGPVSSGSILAGVGSNGSYGSSGSNQSAGEVVVAYPSAPCLW